jgi:hypothetical protein
VSFDSAATSLEMSWESASLMTLDECVNVATDMLVAMLYNFMMLSQGMAMMEKSSASTMLSLPRLEDERGVPLIASQNPKFFVVQEAS